MRKKRIMTALILILTLCMSTMTYADSFFKQLEDKYDPDKSAAADAFAPFMNVIFTAVLIFAGFLLLAWIWYFGKDVFDSIKGRSIPGIKWLMTCIITLVCILFIGGGAIWKIVDFAQKKLLDPATDIIEKSMNLEENHLAKYDLIIKELI